MWDPSLGWTGTLQGRDMALQGMLRASQNQAVGRCELLVLKSSWGFVHSEDVSFLMWVRA